MANRYWNPRPKQRKDSEKSEFERAFDKRAKARINLAVREIVRTQPGK